MFCIGYVRTGTTSFGAAMRMLGFRHATFEPHIYRDWFKKGRLDKILRYAMSYDSFDDLPYSRLDVIALCTEHFPNSKFVLLERDPDQWLESWLAHRSSLRLPAPHAPEKARAWLLARNDYLKHFFHTSAMQHRLMSMDITRGEGFEKLCPFLNKPQPDAPFPWRNARADREQRLTA